MNRSTCLVVLFVLGVSLVSGAQEKPLCFTSKDNVFKLEVCVPKEAPYKEAYLQLKVLQNAPVILEMRVSGEAEIEGVTVWLPLVTTTSSATTRDPKAGATFSRGNGVPDERVLREPLSRFYTEKQVPAGARITLSVSLIGVRETPTGRDFPTVSLEGIKFPMGKP